MANKYTTLSGLFAAIADAIRSKTSGSAQIVADDFPEAISDLVSGSDYRGQNLISTIAQGTSYTQNGIEAKIRSDLSPAVIDENSKIVIPNSAIVSLLGITSKKIVNGETIAGVTGVGKSANLYLHKYTLQPNSFTTVKIYASSPDVYSPGTMMVDKTNKLVAYITKKTSEDYSTEGEAIIASFNSAAISNYMEFNGVEC
ncbi:MAG: hypothetical protein ACLVAI_00205 [Anaerovoracaceae bacterium]